MRGQTRRVGAALAIVLLVIAGLAVVARSADDPNASAGNWPRGDVQPAYMDNVDKVMNAIGDGKVDDAVALMDVMKKNPDLREQTRSRLNDLHLQEGNGYGYDVVSVQRFSDRLHIVSVLGYYQDFPVLFRFQMYHPKGQNDPWMVLDFEIHANVAEELKDTPIDYVRHRSVTTK